MPRVAAHSAFWGLDTMAIRLATVSAPPGARLGDRRLEGRRGAAGIVEAGDHGGEAIERRTSKGVDAPHPLISDLLPL
jgi:hypothetical protein